jgi:beta-glucosidase-like glycosyl hydrolase
MVDVSTRRRGRRLLRLTLAGNWEGFSPEPYLAGQIVAETVKGIQSSGVVATTKHYIANEQEVSIFV